jgi:hypothetical protein
MSAMHHRHSIGVNLKSGINVPQQVDEWMNYALKPGSLDERK